MRTLVLDAGHGRLTVIPLRRAPVLVVDQAAAAPAPSAVLASSIVLGLGPEVSA